MMCLGEGADGVLAGHRVPGPDAGAMSALRAPAVVEGLEPFAEPDLC